VANDSCPPQEIRAHSLRTTTPVPLALGSAKESAGWVRTCVLESHTAKWQKCSKKT